MGSNAEGGASLRSTPCAPDGAHPLPLAGLQMRTGGLRLGLSLTEPAEERRSQGDSLGWPSPEKTIQAGQAKRIRAQNTGLASTERGREGGRNGKGSREKQSQTEMIRNRDGETQKAGERQRQDRDRER